jgi:predicted nucleic acid-binding protein
MIIVLDANVLLRLADPTNGAHGIAATAVSALCAQGNTLHIIPQSVYEFWAVATRPIANNGLGLSSVECLRELANLKASFPLLDDGPTLFTEWEVIVSAFSCQGKAAHDARYVAAMRTRGSTHLLTFNVKDFSRYSGLTVLDPIIVAASAPPGSTL